MSPIILIAIFVALASLAAYMVDLCLRRWPRTAWNTGLRRLFWLAPYIVLTLVPIAGAFLPNSPVSLRSRPRATYGWAFTCTSASCCWCCWG